MSQPTREPSRSQTCCGRVLVTGGTGFVGSAVVRALLNSGYNVRVLARATSPRHHLDGLDVEIVEGDLRNRAKVARALEDCRYLVHTAADYRLWVPNPEEMASVNVDGTRIIMEEALHFGTERIVHTSTVATIALDQGGRPADESRLADPKTAIGCYKRSKIEAERLVLAMVRDRALPAVIVNPSTPMGPRDIKPTPTGQMVVAAARGRIPAFVDTGLNLAHVDDIALGHVAALRQGRIGERYILGGENVPLKALLAEISTQMGRYAAHVRLPRGMLTPFAVVSEVMARRTGQAPLLTRESLRMAAYRMYFTHARAATELDYRPRPWKRGVSDAIGWFRQAGYLS